MRTNTPEKLYKDVKQTVHGAYIGLEILMSC